MSTEAQQFFDRLVTAPSSARQTLYAALIDGLVSDGVWTKLDTLFVFAANDSATARVNLIGGTFYLASYGATSFQLDHTGYKGTNNTADYLDSEYNFANSTGQYVRNSAAMGAFLVAGPASGADSGAVMGGGAANYAYIWPHYSDNNFYWTINTTADHLVATAGSTGLFSCSRTAANAIVAYINGVQVQTAADASTALPDSSIQVMRANYQTVVYPAATVVKVGAAFSGVALTAGDHLALYNRLNTYLTAVNGLVGSADIVVLGSTASNVVASNGKFNATPGVTKLQSGTLFCVYTESTDSNVTDGVWKYKTSTDSGATWSAATTLYTPAANHSAVDVNVMTAADGTVIVSGFDYDNITPANTRPIVLIGTANLSSFSAAHTVHATQLEAGTAGVYTTSKCIQLGNGTLVLPVYGLESGIAKYSVAVSFSTDGGVTWGNAVTVVSGTATEQYGESNGVRLTNRLVLIIRHDESAGATGYLRCYSDDSGQTWSTPAAVVDGIATIITPGRPDVTAYSGQRLLMWGRFPSDHATTSRWGYSTDAGVHFSPFTPFGVSTDEYFYASSVLVSDGVVGSVLARQNNGSATDAYIVYQDFSVVDAPASCVPLLQLLGVSGCGAVFLGQPLANAGLLSLEWLRRRKNRIVGRPKPAGSQPLAKAG